MATALLVSLLLGVLLGRWGDSLLSASEGLRENAARRAWSLVRRTLDPVQSLVTAVDRQAQSGVLDLADSLDVEKALLAELLRNPDIEEATFTWEDGGGGDGSVRRRRLRGQVSVYREGDPPAIVTSWTHGGTHGLVTDRRVRPAGDERLVAAPFRRVPGSASDPTEDDTFKGTLAHHRFSDEPLFTDLHFAERDEGRPQGERRVVVTAMQAVEGTGGRPVGVVRAGLVASRLDDVTALPVDAADASDPRDRHRVFLADEQGRLLTRLDPGQGFVVEDDDAVRPASGALPVEMRAALDRPELRGVGPERPQVTTRFDVTGRRYILSAFHLAGAQDWRVGVLVPEDHYLAGLRRTRRRLLVVSVVALALLAGLGVAALRSVRGSLRTIVASTGAMREFDFAPAPVSSPFLDVAAVMADLEQAKTALRAMGRYVPIGLVRQLYRSRRDPVLGGELRELSLLFTDIEGFTTASEHLPPDRLARALGRYFEALTRAIHASGGVVDKYIGDGVMALWNAPEPQPGHARCACVAALACRDASRALERESVAEGLPPFRSRLGLHRAEVMVGHFGAPDRISYTALGDGVNLASRLEGLNKLYGTSILASGSIRDAAGPGLVFRLVDVVAVKGRRGGVRVFELLGAEEDVDASRREAAASYERALEAYQARRFADALEELRTNPADPPGRVLAARCRTLLANPPPGDWDGTFVASEK